jgi:hypothetical protein
MKENSYQRYLRITPTLILAFNSGGELRAIEGNVAATVAEAIRFEESPFPTSSTLYDHPLNSHASVSS